MAHKQHKLRTVPPEVLSHLRLVFETLARGRAEAITKNRLVALLLANGLPASERVVRRAMGVLIREGLPVGCGPAGYYLCLDADDVAAATRDLRSRICHISKREWRLRKVFADYNGGQMVADPRDLLALAVGTLAAAAEGDADDD